MKTKKTKITVAEFKAQYKDLQAQLKTLKAKMKDIHKEVKEFSKKSFNLRVAGDDLYAHKDGRIIPAFIALPKLMDDLEYNERLDSELQLFINYM